MAFLMVLGTRVWSVASSMSPAESHDRFPRLLQGVLRNGIEGVAGRVYCRCAWHWVIINDPNSHLVANILIIHWHSIGMGVPHVQTKPCKFSRGSIGQSQPVPAWICCRHRKWTWNLDKLNRLAHFLSLHCRWARQHRFLPLTPWK